MNPKLYVQTLALVVLAIGLQACANTNPLAVAETPAQKGYAIERAYNIVLEQAVELARSRPELRSGIVAVESRTTPAIDTLSSALAAYEIARAQFDGGGLDAAGLAVALVALEAEIRNAQTALLELSDTLTR